MPIRPQRRFAGFYSIDDSCTLSRLITTSGSDDSDGTMPVTIPEYYRLNRSIGRLDHTYGLEISNVIELPFGKGKPYLADLGFLSALVAVCGRAASSALSAACRSPSRRPAAH